MSWVLLALRKSELKMTQSQLVARELQISRAQRRAAREYQIQGRKVRSELRTNKNSLFADYKSTRNKNHEQISDLRAQQNTIRENFLRNKEEELATLNDSNKNGSISDDDYKQEYARITNTDERDRQLKQLEDKISQLEKETSDKKEDYEQNLSNLQSVAEDDLEQIESEANDEDTMYEEEKVENETQLESVKQELQVVSDAISEYIQSETIKI